MSKKINLRRLKKTEFADLMGLNRSAATRHCQNGKLAVNSDGTIDLLSPFSMYWVAKRMLSKNEPSYERRMKALAVLCLIEREAERKK